MKSYLEENNLRHFTFSPNFGKPMKAIICYLPPDTHVEYISNNLEDIDFNVVNMRQMTAT
jgi:hypothetical protein